jgi:hypothetical protein
MHFPVPHLFFGVFSPMGASGMAQFVGAPNNDQRGFISKFNVLRWCRSTDLNRDTREGGRF